MAGVPRLPGAYHPFEEEAHSGPVIDRAALFPIGQYEDGSLTFAWPGFLKDMYEGAVRSYEQGRHLPRVDDQGFYAGTPRAEPLDAFNAASIAPMGAFGARATGLTRDVGDLGMFAGRGAKTADHAKLSQAERMAAEGAPREQIWNDTGWFQGVDGKWRFEIDDRYSTPHLGLFRMAPGLKSHSGFAQEQFMHPEFYAAYPDAKDLSIQYLRDVPNKTNGAYYKDRGLWAKVRGPDETRSTVLHELQHDIQNREGFASGVSPKSFTPEQIGLERNRLSSSSQPEAGWTSVGNFSPEMTDEQIAYALYRRNAGETEARTVQARRDMSPEQRAERPPWLDYDVPESMQLFANDTRASLPALAASSLEQPQGIRAYHGSPHDFDKFSLDKIGTGEGAQAYGHGLYFAGNEDTARWYRDALTDPADTPEAIALGKLDTFKGDRERAAKSLEKFVRPLQEGTSPDVDAYFRALRLLQGSDEIRMPANSGRMYEVRINAEPEQFLDWDKPVGQQSPHIRDSLAPFGLSDDAKSFNILQGIAENLRVKNRIAPDRDLGVQVSDVLRDSGLPGIRYLDQGSRNAGDGTYNYVVFDDDLVEILRKYANPDTASLPYLFTSQPNDELPAWRPIE